MFSLSCCTHWYTRCVSSRGLNDSRNNREKRSFKNAAFTQHSRRLCALIMLFWSIAANRDLGHVQIPMKDAFFRILLKAFNLRRCACTLTWLSCHPLETSFNDRSGASPVHSFLQQLLGARLLLPIRKAVDRQLEDIRISSSEVNARKW